MTDRPQIDNAPGLTWRPLKTGWEARWQARTDLIKRGYEPKSARLWSGVEPTPVDVAFISERCLRLQATMLVWARGGELRASGAFDGTLRGLIRSYQTDPDSGYRSKRYHSRVTYANFCRRLEDEHGDVLVANIKGRDLIRWHREWTPRGVTLAYSLIAMLRILAKFGATILEDPAVRNLKALLSDMHFKQPKPRTSILTLAHAEAIRAKAHELGLHSIALAQALQFECTLRQKDVIGEWVPLHEPEPSDICSGYNKWLRGVRWNEIDDRLILRHLTSKRDKEVEIDLKNAPMVMEELRRLDQPLPANGPMIVYEKSGVPYTGVQFRVLWRKVAHEAGVPKSVFNMDTRAGAITEATHSGAALEDVRHAAAHSDISMTARYSREAAAKTAKVMQQRVAGRGKAAEQGENMSRQNGPRIDMTDS